MKVVSGKILYGVVSIACIAAIYFVINFGLVGIQKWWHHDDEVKLENMKEELSSLKEDIDGQEEELSSLQEELKQPVEDENTANATLATYNDLYSQYKMNIDTYNQKVEEANELAKDIGSTWIIVPVPGKK